MVRQKCSGIRRSYLGLSVILTLYGKDMPVYESPVRQYRSKSFHATLISPAKMCCSVKARTQWENALPGQVKFPSKSPLHMVLPMSVPEHLIMCLMKEPLSGAPPVAWSLLPDAVTAGWRTRFAIAEILRGKRMFMPLSADCTCVPRRH